MGDQEERREVRKPRASLPPENNNPVRAFRRVGRGASSIRIIQSSPIQLSSRTIVHPSSLFATAFCEVKQLDTGSWGKVAWIDGTGRRADLKRYTRGEGMLGEILRLAQNDRSGSE